MNNEQIKAMLYPERSVYSVLGNVCKDPRLLRSPEIEFKPEDFYKDIHRICFIGVHNLTLLNPNRDSITAIELDNYWAESPKIYEEWEELDGYEYMTEAIENSDKNSFIIDYDRLKKFSLLRAAIDKGFDVREIYPYDGRPDEISEAIKVIDNMDIGDLVNHFSLKVIDLKQDFSTDSTDSYHMGDDIDNLIENILSEPQFGVPFRNPFYNTIFGGMMPGKLMLRSADTGNGKTRNNLADLVGVGMKRYWSFEHNKFIDNPFATPTLYIGTEEKKLEVQMDILSIVSGVAPDIIKSGILIGEYKDRIQEATQIMKESMMFAHRDDDFSIQDIEMIIEKHIIEYDVKNIVFDYIQITPKITRNVLYDFGGIQKRDDQILEYFSSSLKNIAEEYQVFIMSGTQLNRNHKQKDMRDSASLAGGSATARKVDYGVQLYKATSEDIDKLRPILDTGLYETPNYSHWVYKNRGGKHDEVIIWSRIDLGVVNERPLFVTDKDYNLLEIQPTYITMSEGEKVIDVDKKVHIKEVLESNNDNPYLD